MHLPDLSARATPGATFALRVQPRARREGLEVAGDRLLVRVNAPPVDGRANEAVRRMLAAALGVAPSRLVLLRGDSGRDKLFRLD
jgi:uncharacterized protein YggU (UPF0235/DUF167 family)